MRRTALSIATFSMLSLAGGSALAAELPGKLGNQCEGVAANQIQAVYDGQWAETLDQTFLVTKLDKEGGTFEGYYSHGVAKNWNIPQGFCWKVSGTFEGDLITLETFRNGSTVKLTIKGEALVGEFIDKNGRITPGTFDQVN